MTYTTMIFFFTQAIRKNKELKAKLGMCLDKDLFHGNSLQGICMSPMQRTIFYMLMLERLQKTTSNEVQLEAIKKSHKEVKASIQVMDHANRSIRSLRSLATKVEGLPWVGTVTEKQRIVKEGNALGYINGQGHELYCVLLIKRLLLCVKEGPRGQPADLRSSGTVGQGKFKLLESIYVDARTAALHHHGENKIVIQYFEPGMRGSRGGEASSTYELTFDSTEERGKWLTDLENQCTLEDGEERNGGLDLDRVISHQRHDVPAAPSRSLPGGWAQAKDPGTGRDYYFKTGPNGDVIETTWTHPSQMSGEAAGPPAYAMAQVRSEVFPATLPAASPAMARSASFGAGR